MSVLAMAKMRFIVSWMLLKKGQGIKAASHAFNVPPKTLRRHRDQQSKTPGHSHLGGLPVFTGSFKCDLVSHVQKWKEPFSFFDLAERMGIQNTFNKERWVVIFQ
jgi:hypothetical protein